MSPVPSTDDENEAGQRAAKLAARRSKLAQCGFPVYVRFDDLVAAGIVANWTTLLRLIDDENFPAGVMIGPNMRAWPVNELETWLASRPSARKVVPADAVHPRVRDKRRAEKTA